MAAVAVPIAKAAELRGLEVAPFTVQRAGTLSAKALREVSGMATSRRRDDLFWVHNDSGARARVYAMTSTGRDLGSIKIRSATARDWEDMASFEFDGRPMLVVADVGDNNAKRPLVWLHVIEEPVVPEDGLAVDAASDIAWSIPLRFPDGAADCESIAVDTTSGQILLLTKRQNPPILYAVPIKPAGAKPASGKVVDAVKLAELTTIPRPAAQDLLSDPVLGAFSSQPTAMDLAGDELAVLTYRNAYRFVRSTDQSWQAVLNQAPTIIELPKLKQAESLAFDRKGRDIYITSEKRNAPILRVQRAALGPTSSIVPDTVAGDKHVD